MTTAIATFAPIACLLAASAAEPTLVIVDNGQPRCSIAIPDEATPSVRLAAEELVRYFKKMSGAELQIASESQASDIPRIDVGLTRKALSLAPQGFAGDDERILIRSLPDGLLVCGGGDRGARFAVYRLLELLGCRWLAPEPQNEFIPRRSTLAAEAVDIDTRPAFEWRLFNAPDNPQHERWGVKLGFNGLYSAEAAQQNGGCLYWPTQASGVHTYCQIMPNDPYFASHPEWYPLLDGKREPTALHGRQLCVTAPGLAEQFAANVARIFAANPTCQLMSISPNDGRGWCQCKACEDLDNRLCGGRSTEQGLAGERPFRGDRVFWFANQVAGRVSEQFPNKSLLVLAYINYAEPPDTVRPLPNVVPFLCHYAPADYSRAINDPDSAPNRQFNELLKRWIPIAPQLMIYSYVSKSMWWRLPRPVLRPFAADIKYFHDLGLHRYYCQSSLNDWPLDGPLYYVIGRLLWDPSANPDAIAEDWIAHMFGPAAPHMATFYEAVDAAVRKTGKPYSDNPPRDVPGLYDHEALDRAMMSLSQAENTPAEELVRRRVSEAARTFRYGYWMIEAIEQHQRFMSSFDREALEAASAAGRKALSYCRVRESARLLDSWRIVTELGVLSEGFGKTESKGGRRCWNSDETGPEDGRSGWAAFYIPTPDTSQGVTLEMDVWGVSALGGVVVNTSGDGRGYSAGGVWTRIEPQKRLSGKEQWDTLVFHIPPKALAPNRPVQKIGFGGGDSQAWIAEIRTRQP